MCDKLRNGATYDGEILPVDPCPACDGHGLGQMSMGGRHLEDKKLSYRRETARQLHMTTWAGQLTF